MKFRYIVLLAAVLFFFLMRMRPARFFGSPRPVAPAASTAVQGVRITQFYPSVAKVPIGEKALLCYGVEGAKSVRLDPPIEKIWPAFTRCFDINPTRTTTYTLTAEDAGGQSVSQSVVVEIGAARPKIIEVSVNKLRIQSGETVTLCFKARNAKSFDVGGLKPIAVPPTPDRACFADQPTKTRTYTVKVEGPGGEDSERVTVTVK